MEDLTWAMDILWSECFVGVIVDPLSRDAAYYSALGKAISECKQDIDGESDDVIVREFYNPIIGMDFASREHAEHLSKLASSISAGLRKDGHTELIRLVTIHGLVLPSTDTAVRALQEHLKLCIKYAISAARIARKVRTFPMHTFRHNLRV